jgi:8-oxo-dGTP diphosphatase
MSTMVDDENVPIAAAVIVNKGAVLMVRRRVGEGDLSWQFPAGKVQPGESGDGAAVRETQEETGLAVRAVSQLGSRVHPITGRVMLYVACEVVGGIAHVAAESEVAEVGWCDRAALAGKVSWPFHEPVQEHLNARLC